MRDVTVRSTTPTARKRRRREEDSEAVASEVAVVVVDAEVVTVEVSEVDEVVVTVVAAEDEEAVVTTTGLSRARVVATEATVREDTVRESTVAARAEDMISRVSMEATAADMINNRPAHRAGTVTDSNSKDMVVDNNKVMARRNSTVLDSSKVTVQGTIHNSRLRLLRRAATTSPDGVALTSNSNKMVQTPLLLQANN